MLVHDSRMERELVVQPSQHVIMTGGSSSLQQQAPLWGGTFTVQAHGSLDLTFIALGATATIHMSGGALSLAQMALSRDLLLQVLVDHDDIAGTAIQLNEVSVINSGDGTDMELTGLATVEANAAKVYDPPEFEVRHPCPLHLVVQ
jgi:hypothetical protein